MKYLILLLIPFNALALDLTIPDQPYGLSLIHLAASDHHGSNYDYNERHDGTGIELSKGVHRLGFIPKYKNSYGDPSTLIYYGHTYETVYGGFGGIVGCADGYKTDGGEVIRCLVTPTYTASMEVAKGFHLGFTFSHTPALGNSIGLSTLLFRLKFDGEK